MESLRREDMAVYRLRGLYEAYGYSQFKMSKFEEYDLYVQNKSFLVSDHVITFTDTNGKLMALKPDVTLSIVKNHRDSVGVQKVHYDENVYRVSGGSGAYKEIMQVGLECLGDVDSYCLSEVLTLASLSLREISEDYVLDVSHLGITTCVLDAMGLSAGAKTRVLECMGQKNLHGAEAAAKEDGADAAAVEMLKKLMTLYGAPNDVLPQLQAFLPEQAKAMADELKEILAAVPQKNLRMDFSVVQDMEYYNGIVFKGFVAGVPAAVLSGGQYDRLMEKMGKRSGAVGFAVYMDLLEDLQTAAAEYDVDTVVLYDDSCEVTAVAETMGQLAAAGKTATALKAVPEKLRYRELVKVGAK